MMNDYNKNPGYYEDISDDLLFVSELITKKVKNDHSEIDFEYEINLMKECLHKLQNTNNEINSKALPI